MTTEQQDEKPVLRWVGAMRPDGLPSRFWAGVPTRDLTAAELDDLPAGVTEKRLVDSELYAPVTPAKPKAEKE
jgi:hypothetical protein